MKDGGSMAYYVQLDADYWDHPKTLYLTELLGPKVGAAEIPPRMWCWAARYCHAGVFRSVAQLALACRFRGKPETLQSALVTSGFLEADGLTIHEWMEHTGGDIAVYEAKKERSRSEIRRKRCRNVSATDKNVGETLPPIGSDRIGTDRNGTDPPIAVVHLERLLRIARTQKIAGQDGTIRKFVEAWAARVGESECEKMLMACPGHAVMDIQDKYFPRNGKGNDFMDKVREGLRDAANP